MGRGEGYGRPAILKPEDIQAMADNDEEEEGGWAGAQDEVDYAAKLDFEDFEDDEKPHTEASRKPERETTSEPETRWQSNESRSVSDVIFLLASKQFFLSNAIKQCGSQLLFQAGVLSVLPFATPVFYCHVSLLVEILEWPEHNEKFSPP